MKGVTELSLRPYHGRLFLADDKKAFIAACRRKLKSNDAIPEAADGAFAGQEVDGGDWVYIIWANTESSLAHEICHILFHVFDRAGMDPRDSKGEAFCYMLSQLMLDAKYA